MTSRIPVKVSGTGHIVGLIMSVSLYKMLILPLSQLPSCQMFQLLDEHKTATQLLTSLRSHKRVTQKLKLNKGNTEREREAALPDKITQNFTPQNYNSRD